LSKSHMIPVAEDMVRSAYARAGKPDLYDRETVYYAGEHQRALMAAVMGYMYKERPAASFLFGTAALETITILGAAATIGALQIGGSSGKFGYFVSTCDYCLICDEQYAAAAAITQKKSDLGTILGMDYLKLLAMLLMVISLAVNMAGPWWAALLKL